LEKILLLTPLVLGDDYRTNTYLYFSDFFSIVISKNIYESKFFL